MKTAVFWAIMLIALIALHFVLLEETSRLIPSAVLFTNQSGLGVSVSDIIDAPEDFTCSARLTEYGALSTKNPPKSTNAKFVYANTLPELQMINGVFPSASRTVAISDTLAVKWFFSTDVLGAELYIGNESFNICGVFREESSILESRENEMTVYLPLSAYPDNDAQITELWSSINGGLIEQTLDSIAAKLGKRIQAANVTNYQSISMLAKQSGRVLWFVLGIPIAGALFISFARHAATVFRRIRVVITGYEHIADKKELTWQIVRCLLCLLGGIGVVLLVSFDLYLPSNWSNGSNEYRSVILLYGIDVLALLAIIILIRAITRKRSS